MLYEGNNFTLNLKVSLIEDHLNHKMIFDISATNIPEVRKTLNFFSTPQLAFYEIANASTKELVY